MKGLKQSTVATVIVGPVLDSTGAAVTNAVVGDFRLAKNGTVATLSGATVTHDANGYYLIALTTGNTDTTGRLVLTSGNTAHSMASHHWSVLPASVFDAIYTNATNSTGGLATATGNITALAGAVSTLTAGAVWDEVLTGATHNIASSAGRRLRQLASVIVRAGTAQGPGTGNNQIQLDAGASATNGEYDPNVIFIETGTGAGQARLILQYNGSTKVATVDRDWRINPDNTSEFVILADAGRNSVNEGLAQGGTSTTITLNASASATDDAYNGQLVFIRSGTGQDQVGLVEDYVGSTKVATIRTRSATGQWETVPDTTSAYMMIPNLTFTVSEIQSGLATSTALAAVATNVTALVNRIPETLFAGITSLAKWLGAIAGKTADSTTRSQINATAAGASFNETTDSLEAIRDRGDAAWTSGGGAGGVTNITVEDRSITLE
jgi:hypothetical protein